MRSMRYILGIMLALMCIAGGWCASREFLHVITSQGESPVEHVVSVPMGSGCRTYHGLDSITNAESLIFVRRDSMLLSVPIDNIRRVKKGADVARIYIRTDSAMKDVTSKEEYVHAEISIGAGTWCDTLPPTRVNIKGRGNTTWDMPKKPYRLKFEKKVAIGDMKKAKSYVLLANYIDPTLVHNAFAFKLAELLGLPYTNHALPADVYFNNRYCGSYLLTEKLGLNSGSIYDVDEAKGVVYEVSDEFDEEWKFRSPVYQLPVMIKDPDFTELQQADSLFSAEEAFMGWKDDFELFERSVAYPDDERDLDGMYRGLRPERFVDMDELARWVIVYLATGCGELNHPKSVYMHRASRWDKFHFGPVWDFDWLVDYYGNENNLWVYDFFLLEEWRESNAFFKDLFSRDSFRRAMDNVWEDFVNIIWPEAIDYLYAYADVIEASALRNGELYSLSDPDRYEYMKASTETFRSNVEQYADWLHMRIQFLNFAPNHGIREEY